MTEEASAFLNIHVVEYPCEIGFTVNKGLLPPFKYGCSVRTKILREQLAKKPKLWANAPHAIEDFIVETIEKTKTGERWYVGS